MTAAALLLAGALLGAVEDRGAPARVRSVPLEISAPGNCPASEVVAAEIDRILGGTRQSAGGAAGLDRADIDEEAERVRVRLVGSDGRIVGERSIQTAAADCAERAAAAAIVLATWETDLRSPVTLDPPSVAAEAPPAPSPSPWSAALGLAGLGVASTTDAWAPGASLDAEIAHRRGWGLRTTLWGTGARYEPLATGVGRARWTRWALGIGPSFRSDVGPVRIAAVAELALARIAVSGDGLSRAYGDAMLDWGARGALEVSVTPWAPARRGPIALVVGLGAAYWPRRHQVMAVGLAATTRTLPPVDALMSLGLRWEIGR
jgi:hypothetical protein